jgi:hypothetical protein
MELIPEWAYSERIPPYLVISDDRKRDPDPNIKAAIKLMVATKDLSDKKSPEAEWNVLLKNNVFGKFEYTSEMFVALQGECRYRTILTIVEENLKTKMTGSSCKYIKKREFELRLTFALINSMLTRRDSAGDRVSWSECDRARGLRRSLLTTPTPDIYVGFPMQDRPSEQSSGLKRLPYYENFTMDILHHLSSLKPASKPEFVCSPTAAFDNAMLDKTKGIRSNITIGFAFHGASRS